MKKEKIEISLSDRKEMIYNLNFELLKTIDSMKGLHALAGSFFTGSIVGSYYGPEKGSPEYIEMIELAYNHILTTLDGITCKLDEINNGLDAATIGM